MGVSASPAFARDAEAVGNPFDDLLSPDTSDAPDDVADARAGHLSDGCCHRCMAGAGAPVDEAEDFLEVAGGAGALQGLAV
ncbi:hypothetical protein ACFV1F_38860 [Streptomyces sp. NPDC059590]|uniref:hypothetical protein n=1 Tax=Streptomyces sp. NPDC059590 TaxID=3346877 RepID=UPI0036B1AEF0